MCDITHLPSDQSNRIMGIQKRETEKRMKISEAKDKFIRSRKLMYCSQKTIKSYQDTLSLFINAIGDIEAEELSIKHINYYNELLVDRKLSQATVGSYLRQIKAFVNYMEDYGIIPEGSVARRIKLPRQPKRKINLFTPEEVAFIFSSVKEESEWLVARDKLMLALMYDSGLRQGELPKLSMKDLDFERNIMLVHGKGNKDRHVPFGDITLALLKDYLDKRPYNKEYLLVGRRGEPITNDSVKKFIHRLSNRTQLEGLSSHRLRHNFATNWCIEGYEKEGYVDNIKLAAIMGHEDLSTTQRYMHEAQSIVATTHFRSHLDQIGGDPGHFLNQVEEKRLENYQRAN